MDITILYWVLLALMIVGVLGAVLPGIPGAILILAAIVVWGVVQGFSDVALPLGVTVLILLLNIGIDFLANYWGAKQVGASKWGQIGSIIGLLVGVFGLLPALPFGGPLLGVLLGPLLGAIVGEFFYRRELQLADRVELSFKAGVGIVVGSLIGKLVQGLLALAAVAVFVLTTWPMVSGV